ncbi:MAG: hypothetical protein V4671_00715 [Armatimonadota bacterium]
MLIGYTLQLFFGLIITALFCAAAVVAARRAPRQLLWITLVAASRCCGTIAGAISLIYLNRTQGGRSLSAFSGLMTLQAVLSTFSNFILFAGAVALLLFLLGESKNGSSVNPRLNR